MVKKYSGKELSRQAKKSCRVYKYRLFLTLDTVGVRVVTAIHHGVLIKKVENPDRGFFLRTSSPLHVAFWLGTHTLYGIKRAQFIRVERQGDHQDFPEWPSHKRHPERNSHNLLLRHLGAK